MYHIVWNARNILRGYKSARGKYYKETYGNIGDVLKALARQNESEVIEGHLIPDDVHMAISILPKDSVSQAVVHIMGKSGIHIARNYMMQKQNFGGYHF